MPNRTIAFFLLIFSAMLLVSCGGDEIPKHDSQKAVTVKAMKITVQALDQQAAFSGTAEPIDRVRLSTKLMGWVEAIHAKEGEAIQKGQTLVKIRSEELQAKRQQAEAAIAEAEAHLKNVQKNYQRIQSLYEKQAATQKERDDMEAALVSAKSKKETARQMKNEVEELLAYTNLTAPFDGVVSRKMIEQGDLANPGQPILEVENTNQIKIVASVPETMIQSLEQGMPVRVKVAAVNVGTNGKSEDGIIDRIVPAGDPMSRQFEVQVVMDNQDNKIKSGMFARIVVGQFGRETLLAPKQAVFRRGQLEGLFVVDSDNRARLRWVRTGVEHHDQVEILSGLNPGEVIVVEGASEILDGQKVEAAQ